MYKDSVIPLYLKSIDNKYQSIGSAVLITYKGKLFFVTAAHVMEALNGEKTFIYFEQIFYEIAGFTAFVSDCSLFRTRNEDPIDLAVMPLPKKLFDECDTSKFISSEHYLKGVYKESGIYQALGYPHVKNTKAANKTANIEGGFKTEAVRYTVYDVGNNAMPYKKFHHSFHIATCLTKTARIQNSDQKTNLPDLHGMSGGLLQKVMQYNPVTDNFDIAYPAGIILEKKNNNSAFFSLRLSVVFEWMDLHWDDLLKDIQI